MNIKYLEARKIDKFKIINFLIEMDNEFPIPLSDKVNIEEYVTKLLKSGKIYCALNEENIIGIIAGYNNDFSFYNGYISVLVIDKNYRGRKISKELLYRFINNAELSKMNKIQVYTYKTNIEAIGLYEKFGFKKIKLYEDGNYHFEKLL